MKHHQQVATMVFKYASIAFGIVGLLMILTSSPDGHDNPILNRLLFATVFIILPSFALSVAGKYLDDK